MNMQEIKVSASVEVVCNFINDTFTKNDEQSLNDLIKLNKFLKDVIKIKKFNIKKETENFLKSFEK